MDKKAMRRTIGEKKRAMTREEIESASERLTEKFLQTEFYCDCRSIYAYLSYNQEVRTDALIRRAIQDGKRIAVPKVYGDEMRFLWLDDSDQVAPGAYGIPEPIADEPIANDDTALVLMPGLAFDPEGRRLGYGGGFYDRFLAKEPNHPLVALCYGFQMFDHLETEAHDIPVDLVIADT